MCRGLNFSPETVRLIMLLVRAKAGPSKIHGKGLIAQEFIPKGTAIWEFKPGFDVALPEADLEKLSPAAKDQVLYYAFLDPVTRTFILSSDDDRFTNHADQPNTWSQNHLTVAIEDIPCGEEITANYEELNVIGFLREKRLSRNEFSLSEPLGITRPVYRRFQAVSSTLRLGRLPSQIGEWVEAASASALDRPRPLSRFPPHIEPENSACILRRKDPEWM